MPRPDRARGCAADFLTGAASRDGAARRVPAVPVPVDERRPGAQPPFCRD